MADERTPFEALLDSPALAEVLALPDHPDVDPEPPVARATDDPDYDEAEQQEVEKNPGS